MELTSAVSTNENGNYPRIAAWYTSSEDKVYFFYSNTSSVKKWREYNVTSSSWGNINQAFNIDYSWIMGLSVDATYIYFVLSYLDMNPPYDNKLMFYTKNRSTNNYVSSFEEISNWGLKCYNTVTTDGESHIPVYWYYSGEEEYYVWGIYRKKGTANPYNWDQIFTYTPPQPPTVLNVSSSSNDVHVIWKDNLGNNNGQNLRYKYDDQAPLAPQEFVISQSSNAHPLLSWSENNEIDIDFYVIEKILGESGWQPIDSTTIPYYEDVSETYCTGRWCDGGHYVWYRVKAVDYHPNESLPSEELSTWVNGFDPYKINHGVRIPSEYTLEQNYPNPFNPTTKITYLLPKEGLVTIKVYDVLGNEVAVLVNEIKPEGNYEVEFNASNLPSGVYFYKMQSGKFTEINKMILMR